MLNTVYRLVAPGRIEVEFSDIDLLKEDVLVRPTHLSICHADQRYFQGLRATDILKQKLPMALIHEAIGEIVWDPKGEFKVPSVLPSSIRYNIICSSNPMVCPITLSMVSRI
jgi:ribitol-5-phosphate 2-dehydrogenase (NADP+)